MPYFFDDLALNKPSFEIIYLTHGTFESTWDFFCNSPVLITKHELSNYTLSFSDDYSYKFAVIALKKGKVLGAALFTDLDSEVLLNHLYVKPTARFQGVGSKLMKQIEKYSCNRHISYIDTSSTYMPWMDVMNTQAKINFSHRLGSFYKK